MVLVEMVVEPLFLYQAILLRLYLLGCYVSHPLNYLCCDPMD
jgi:hypothetical protein